MTDFPEEQTVTAGQCAAIRALTDFDLMMLISEIHDVGWPQAARTLEIMCEQPYLKEYKSR